jgi:hypothetical protein
MGRVEGAVDFQMQKINSNPTFSAWRLTGFSFVQKAKQKPTPLG